MFSAEIFSASPSPPKSENCPAPAVGFACFFLSEVSCCVVKPLVETSPSWLYIFTNCSVSLLNSRSLKISTTFSASGWVSSYFSSSKVTSQSVKMVASFLESLPNSAFSITFSFIFPFSWSVFSSKPSILSN